MAYYKKHDIKNSLGEHKKGYFPDHREKKNKQTKRLRVPNPPTLNGQQRLKLY